MSSTTRLLLCRKAPMLPSEIQLIRDMSKEYHESLQGKELEEYKSWHAENEAARLRLGMQPRESCGIPWCPCR